MQRTRKASQQQSAPTLRRRTKKRGPGLTLCREFLPVIAGAVLFLLLGVAGLLHELYSSPPLQDSTGSSIRQRTALEEQGIEQPHVPILPIFAPVPQAESLIEDLLHHQKPTLAGIVALLQKYIAELHLENRKLSDTKAEAKDIVKSLFDLTTRYLGAFDEAYRDKLIFPVREDDSIFLSLAAFREHLLTETLVSAFSQAKHPEKLYVGAVLQNCFGRVLEDGVTIDTTGLPCKTGAQVVGKNKQGRDMTKVSDAPPDPNGIENFCKLPDYKKYCDNGQIRVLYIHDTESLGPAMARYYASKLWAGETYFMQTDSHLRFAEHWDDLYRQELQATKAYPKSILSSYPPGFQAIHGDSNVVDATPGSRLCLCMTLAQDPNPMVRINSGSSYAGHEPRPTQIPFMAAGFFFARAEFLRDIPFDPYMLWLFMGEEIALSARSWTHGWAMYAPRKNWIVHQYRPGRMGLPKFWGNVNRLYKAPGTNNNALQKHVIPRVKNLIGYPDASVEKIQEQGLSIALRDLQNYGLGPVRSLKEYMEFAHMTMDSATSTISCSRNDWCNNGLKE